MERRALMTGLGAAVVAPLTGCISRSEQEIMLDFVNISNRVDDSMSVDVRIEWDGEVVYRDTAEISDASLDITSEWPDDPGIWEVSGRIHGEDWSSISSENAEEDAVAARGFIDDRVTLDLAWALVESPKE